jgi:hypothetical protein
VLSEGFLPKRLQKAMRCTIVTIGCVDEPGDGDSVDLDGKDTERLTLAGNLGSRGGCVELIDCVVG